MPCRKLLIGRIAARVCCLVTGAGAAVLGTGNDLLAVEIGASGNRSPLYAPAAAGNCRFGMMLRSHPIWLWMARKCSGLQ